MGRSFVRLSLPSLSLVIGGTTILRLMPNRSSAVDGVFAALADPSRRTMIERLSRGPASVSELAQPLPMSLPSVLQHLWLLEQRGLVRSRKVGRVRTYRIQPEALRPVERWINERKAGWERRLDRLGEHLDHPEPESRPEDPR